MKSLRGRNGHDSDSRYEAKRKRQQARESAGNASRITALMPCCSTFQRIVGGSRARAAGTSDARTENDSVTSQWSSEARRIAGQLGHDATPAIWSNATQMSHDVPAAFEATAVTPTTGERCEKWLRSCSSAPCWLNTKQKARNSDDQTLRTATFCPGSAALTATFMIR